MSGDSPNKMRSNESAELVARVRFLREMRCFRLHSHGRGHGLERWAQVDRVFRTRQVVWQEVRIQLGHSLVRMLQDLR
jgi:hypothetical protein